MIRIFLTLLILAGTAFAQQNASVAGILKTEEALPAETRVGMHLINLEGTTLREVGSVAPVSGTFLLEVGELEATDLKPFRSGAVPLPGLQNEYRISPEGVNFARAVTKVYLDKNENAAYDGLETDTGFLAIASVEEPFGFFVLLYVDKDATLSADGTQLQLKQGWNVYSVRYPEGGQPLYALHEGVEDVVLDVLNTERP